MNAAMMTMMPMAAIITAAVVDVASIRMPHIISPSGATRALTRNSAARAWAGW